MKANQIQNAFNLCRFSIFFFLQRVVYDAVWWNRLCFFGGGIIHTDAIWGKKIFRTLFLMQVGKNVTKPLKYIPPENLCLMRVQQKISNWANIATAGSPWLQLTSHPILLRLPSNSLISALFLSFSQPPHCLPPLKLSNWRGTSSKVTVLHGSIKQKAWIQVGTLWLFDISIEFQSQKFLR